MKASTAGCQQENMQNKPVQVYLLWLTPKTVFSIVVISMIHSGTEKEGFNL